MQQASTGSVAFAPPDLWLIAADGAGVSVNVVVTVPPLGVTVDGVKTGVP